jgi:hypothetical protein
MGESVPDGPGDVTNRYPHALRVTSRCILVGSNPSHAEVHVADIAEDLRATSDGLIRDLEVLSAMEARKRTLEPGDPLLVELSERVEALAARLLNASSRQRRLTEIGNAKVEARVAAAPEASIEETPRPIADILAEWRAAERQLEAAEPGSAAALEAETLSDHLRQEYRRAHEAHRR